MPEFNSIRFQPSRPLLKEVSADRLNAILSEIKKNRPRGERGITVRQTGDATYIGLAAKLKGGSTGATSKPWDITIEEVEESGGSASYTLKVIPGTLAGILADNYDDEFTASGDGLYYGIARVTTDGTYITGVSIDLSDEAPEYQSAVKFGIATSVDILFGLFKEGESYNVTGGMNIGVSNRNVVVTKPESAPPGKPQFDLWFRLQ